MDPKDNIEKLMNDKDVQFRDFRLNGIETRQGEDGKEEMILEGVACKFDSETVLYKGHYYEIRETIDSHAFDSCDMSDVIFNFNHCGRVYARTRNGSLSVWVEQDGLHMRAILMKDDEGHKELYRDIKEGLIDKMSFAFHVDERTWSFEEVDGGDYEIERCTVTKIDHLYDVSAVDIPAYDTTSISARKAAEPEREAHAEEIRKAKAELELAKAKYFYL